MKTIKEGLNFCNELTFYDHYIVGRVIELNHDRDCIFNDLSKYDFMNEDNCIRVLAATDDISLTVIDRNIENIDRELNNLTVGTLQMLCLDKLYEEEADKENKEINIMNGK